MNCNRSPAHDSPLRRPALATLLGSALLAMASTAALARDDDDHDPEPRDRGYCSATARMLFSACGFEAKDDLFVAKAKCINLADAGERSQCLADARQTRSEAGKECRVQLDWRRAACAVLGEARYDPPFTPDLFDSNFRQLSNPNPYFPLGIGNRWVYLGEGERNVIEVANETKLIEGVTCVVLRDLVYQNGDLKEATDDWYAAARDGFFLETKPLEGKSLQLVDCNFDQRCVALPAP